MPRSSFGPAATDPLESKPALARQVRELARRCLELEASNRELHARLAEVGRSRDFFRCAFDSAPVGHCTLDVNGRILETNPLAADFMGLPQAECVGRKLSAFVWAGDVTTFEQIFGAALWDEQRSWRGVELRLQRSDRRRLQVELGLMALVDAAGSRCCLVSITDRAQVHALQENEARFHRIAAHVEDVYYQTDASGRLAYVSVAYEHVWKRDALAARGGRWFHAVHEDDLPQVLEARRLLSKGDPFDEEYRIVLPDGAIRWVRDRACLIEQPEPQIVGVARDVTDDRQLDEELRQAQKLEALGALAGSVAHDFGNLLQGVMGCLNIALNDATSAERRRDYTRQALIAVRGGASLVGQLMKFGRKERPSCNAISIDTAISGCAKLLQRLLGDHIQLDIDTNTPQSRILADPIQIEQILMNLAANARDAMPGGGRLLIRTEEVWPKGAVARVSALVRLEVRDMGCGMDRETQARVFEPFFTTKTAGHGTGLGLAAVRAVTRALRGEVQLESALGRGTTFIFQFPCVAAGPSLPPREQIARRFGGRVLLVEDDWRVRTSVRQYLEELGFEVVEAGDGAEALSRAQGSLRLLLSDVTLPEMSGPRILDALRNQYPDLEALFMSAHPASYLMEQGLLQEGDIVLQKPFERQDLAGRLTEICSVV